MGLKEYKKKRDFSKTNEPQGLFKKNKKKELRFVVQEHHARHLHYDLRLELHGVLKSWAVPKGPSLQPSEKRLAIMVEDHPYDYQFFEGVIEQGYGKGEVFIWDKGSYNVDRLSAKESEKRIDEGLKKGEIHFTLEGEKLHGEYVMVHLKKADKKNEWLLFKKKSSGEFEKLTPIKESLSGLIQEAPKKKMPHHIKPMLTTLVDAPFDGKDWIFEIKWDGFRAIAEVEKSKVELYSRNLLSFSKQFPIIFEALKQIKKTAVFDGEIVCLDSSGKPNFQLLQNYQENKGSLVYFIFDLLYLDGRDLRELPLIKRKAILQEVLKKLKNPSLQYCDHIEESGKKFFQICNQRGLEGIVAKKKASFYKEGIRGKDWLKIKAHLRQEAIICGFTEPRKSRKNFGSLILGSYKNKKLKYIGHVGGGFSELKLSEVKKRLIPLIQKKSPFQNPPKTNMPVTWVTPKLLCEVSFQEWTSEGIMRQPIFVGLREDKNPQEVTQEKKLVTRSIVKKKTGSKVELTHLDKIFWPNEKITKGDLIDYYRTISPYLLPFLKDRPQTLLRYPDGIEGDHFFQKNLVDHPPWIQTAQIDLGKKTVNYLLIQDLDSLLYAVNLGCIEIHPFFSRIQTLANPDFFVFDLDPEDISFEAVIEVALAIREKLEELSIPCLCKTSASRGLHICVPTKAKYSYEEVKAFALLIAHHIHQQLPKITSLERSPKNRQKKVYIDCFQNNPGQTMASIYSVRARPGAPVSTPLLWKEVRSGLNPREFTIKNIPARLHKMGDIFVPLLKMSFSMKEALKRLS